MVIERKSNIRLVGKYKIVGNPEYMTSQRYFAVIFCIYGGFSILPTVNASPADTVDFGESFSRSLKGHRKLNNTIKSVGKH